MAGCIAAASLAGSNVSPESSIFVMAGLVPAIHVFSASVKQDVDARHIGERKRRRPSDGFARA
jgi:hypothetical protein